MNQFQTKRLAFPITPYLIEARSIGGLSGSPVFVHLSHTRPNKNQEINFSKSFNFLIGTIRGHWDHEEPKWQTTIDFMKELEQTNMGIATVTPVSELHKIIFGEELVAERKQHDEDVKKQVGTTDDSGFSKMTKEDFEAALKKASRKIEPHKS